MLIIRNTAKMCNYRAVILGKFTDAEIHTDEEIHPNY